MFLAAYFIGVTVMCWILGLRIKRQERKWLFKRVYVPDSMSTKSEESKALRFITIHVIILTFLIALGVRTEVALANSLLLAMVPIGYERMQRRKRQRLTESQLESLFINMSSSLFSNQSIAMALRAGQQEAEWPLRVEIERVLFEIESGASLDRALIAMARRIRSEVLNLAIDGILICRETGGNLGALLERLTEVTRSRLILKEKIEAMTTQQKTTAVFVSAIPVIFLLAAYCLNPKYMEYLTKPLGLLILLYSIISISIGFFWLSKMADILPGVDK